MHIRREENYDDEEGEGSELIFQSAKQAMNEQAQFLHAMAEESDDEENDEGG